MKLKNRQIELLTIGLILLILIILTVVVTMSHYKGSGNIGEKAVNYMYTYSKIEDLVEQDDSLKKICNSSAYKYLTATDSDKALNTYLKFKKNPCEVEIIRSNQNSNGGFVLYKLKTSSIAYGRIFMFIYDLRDDKINNPREMECIDFKKESSDVSN